MLPDILAKDLKVIFCGTAAGTRSAAIGHYYAGRGNQFWPLLHELGLTPRRLKPDDDHLLPHFGIGLTNLSTDVAGASVCSARAGGEPADTAELAHQVAPIRRSRLHLGQRRLGVDAGNLAVLHDNATAHD